MKDDLYLINRLINLYIDVKHSLDNNYDIYEHKKYELQDLQSLLGHKKVKLQVFTRMTYSHHLKENNLECIIKLYKKVLVTTRKIEFYKLYICIGKARIQYEDYDDKI